jgi:hypothetical protein
VPELFAVHVTLDTSSTHKTPAIRAWLCLGNANGVRRRPDYRLSAGPLSHSAAPQPVAAASAVAAASLAGAMVHSHDDAAAHSQHSYVRSRSCPLRSRPTSPDEIGSVGSTAIGPQPARARTLA